MGIYAFQALDKCEKGERNNSILEEALIFFIFSESTN